MRMMAFMFIGVIAAGKLPARETRSLQSVWRIRPVEEGM